MRDATGPEIPAVTGVGVPTHAGHEDPPADIKRKDTSPVDQIPVG